MSERDVLSVEEAAKRLGLSRGSAYKAVRAGEIPSIRVGGRWLIPRLAFERFLKVSRDPQPPREASA